MIAEGQLGYVKEFLERLCLTDADKKDATEITDTLLALFHVLNIAKRMVGRPPAAVYAIGSRKSQLQEAIQPFFKTPNENTFP